MNPAFGKESQSFVLPQHFQNLPAPTRDAAFCVYGNIPILVTSVHGVEHLRDGRLKPPDRGTFEMGHLLSKVMGCAFLGEPIPSLADSNHHHNTPFKTDLKRILTETTDFKLVLDIHSSHPGRAHDVEIGTRHGRSVFSNPILPSLLHNLLSTHYVFTLIDQHFCAEGVDGGETITEFVSECVGISAMQIEISSVYVSDDGGICGFHTRSKITNAFAHFSRSI